jgi:tetratricopeptide (TPR) repeat protein
LSEGGSEQLPRTIAERYVVEGKLGQGGMGSILRVLDSVTGRHLALKMITPADGELSELDIAFLQREYYALKQLAHPRIIRAYDYGVADGVPYYTMELLDGEDLRTLAPIGAQRACALLRDVASSLAIIHSRRLIHRDLNPGNVRCTGDGRAKLLDFGALTQMGPQRHFVGAPGFVPPEAVFGQPLDQRSDLYCLGALAYWLLTRRKPHSARTIEELRNALRTKPTLPSTLAKDIPESLEALVMSLLSANPAGRPQLAAEVIDRLTAIGGLPREPDLGVTHAYLSTPQLVGRDEEVIRIRKAIVRSTRGRGSALLVRGDAGAGNTRMLDACVMEAKLLGVLVARADASRVGDQRFAALRDVVEQWAAALPPADVQKLRAVVAEQAGTARQTLDLSDREGGVHARAAAAVLALARGRALMLAVDDADRIDIGSMTVFALLSRGCADRKLVVCANLDLTVDTSDSIPLRMLDEASKPIESRAWTLHQTESLLQSVFGPVPNVALLADRIHRVARGNPRDTMQLAQHLIDSGVIGHQAGAFVLPVKLDEVALPSSMAQAQRLVLDTLDAETRALAAMLALAPDLQRLDIARRARLSPDALGHIDTLLRHDVLVERGVGLAFRHGAFASALVDSLGDAARSECHLSLAQMHVRSGDHPLTVAYHLHRAGRFEQCIEHVRPWLTIDEVMFQRPQLQVLEEIVADPEHYPLNALEAHLCRSVLVRHAVTIDPSYGRYGEASFERLRHDTGLVYWDEHAGLEPQARIGQCLQRALTVYEATPAPERGLAPFDAVRALAILVRSLTSVYARALASEQLIGLSQWLAPLRTLAPVLDLLHELTCVSTDRAVREKRVAHRFLKCAERFKDATLGVDEIVRTSAAAICVYCAAMDEAKQGKLEALAHADELEELPTFAALAWHVRMLSHIYSGDAVQAAECRQRMELLVVAQDEPNTLLAMSVLYEAWGYEMCEDLTGLKGALHRVEQEALKYPGWEPWAVLYRGDVHRLRGEAELALSDYERAIAMTGPGRHQVWPHATERRVVALRELGRLDESLELARMLVQFAVREDLEPVNVVRAHVALAGTATEASLLAEARFSLEQALACTSHEGVVGVPLGIVYEALARTAIRERDAAAFQRAAHRCAQQLLRRHSPALIAKYEGLLGEARAAGLSTGSIPPRRSVDADHPVLARLEAAQDEDARAELVLRALASHYGAEEACLFGVTGTGLRTMATVGRVELDDRLRELVDAFLSAELASSTTVTVTIHDERAASGHDRLWSVGRDTGFLPLLLQGTRNERGLITGVAVLHVHGEAPAPLAPELLRALGQALLIGDRITGMLPAW